MLFNLGHLKEAEITLQFPTTDFLIPYKNSGELYACKTNARLYGKNREVVVYKNVTKATKSLIKRNKAIYEISLDLNELKKIMYLNYNMN